MRKNTEIQGATEGWQRQVWLSQIGNSNQVNMPQAYNTKDKKDAHKDGVQGDS